MSVEERGGLGGQECLQGLEGVKSSSGCFEYMAAISGSTCGGSPFT